VLPSGVIALTRRAFGAYSCGRPGRIGSGLPKERCSWSIDSFPALDGDFIASTSPPFPEDLSWEFPWACGYACAVRRLDFASLYNVFDWFSSRGLL